MQCFKTIHKAFNIRNEVNGLRYRCSAHKSQFQRFLQIKDIHVKHIKQDFHSVAWVMPQVWDLWVLVGQNSNFLNMLMCISN